MLLLSLQSLLLMYLFQNGSILSSSSSRLSHFYVICMADKELYCISQVVPAVTVFFPEGFSRGGKFVSVCITAFIICLKHLLVLFPYKCTQFDPLPTIVIFFHIAQGYRTPPQGIQHNNNHGYAWIRGI